jgi:NhaP-type Na+/H+ or K+/H+ antiporter
VQTLAFAVLALVARSLVLLVALPRTAMDAESRKLVVWFGPRGLSSLLLVLLPIFTGIEGSTALFAPVATVVLLSVVVHGGMLALWIRKLEPAQVSSATEGQETPVVAHSELITFDEIKRLDAGEFRIVCSMSDRWAAMQVPTSQRAARCGSIPIARSRAPRNWRSPTRLAGGLLQCVKERSHKHARWCES